jgi:hypothetical protein
MGAQPGHHIGREMISRVIEEIGPSKVKTIGAEFTDTNRQLFQKSLDKGMSSFDAARNTPFGRALRDLGFDDKLVIVNPTAYPRPNVLYNIQE